MVKTLGLMAVAALAALVLGFGSNLGSATPKAHADTTGVAVIGCEFVGIAMGGSEANFKDACGTEITPATSPRTFAAFTTADVTALALKIGDEDGKLELSDFSSDSMDQSWDDNQLSTDCTLPAGSVNGVGNLVTPQNRAARQAPQGGKDGFLMRISRWPGSSPRPCVITRRESLRLPNGRRKGARVHDGRICAENQPGGPGDFPDSETPAGHAPVRDESRRSRQHLAKPRSA